MPDFANWVSDPALIIPCFIGMWVLVGYVVAAAGGWRSLAKRYAGSGHPFPTERWWMQSGKMRSKTHYSNVLTVGADPRGLYLAVLFLFRVGHPPLFIPWSEVALTERRGRFFTEVHMEFLQVPGVYLQVSEKLGYRVARAGGQGVYRERGYLPAELR